METGYNSYSDVASFSIVFERPSLCTHTQSVCVCMCAPVVRPRGSIWCNIAVALMESSPDVFVFCPHCLSLD